ncbi:MAG: putative O-linked N-acetylglucosamine transferase, family [Alphaproteobacteria bacterium]|nr:putative O-linked N-acetylglucosamine transferase, family [Alphaproteobacteria bacterium]
MDLRAQFEQAVAAHRAGQLTDAETSYRAILRADPGNISTLRALGFLQGQRGRYDEAVTLLGAALKHTPQDHAALKDYGHALMLAGQGDAALAVYDRLLAIHPDAVEVLYNRSIILSERGRTSEALAALDRALALQPGSAMVIYSRGVMMSQLGRHEEALANYDRALALDPNLMPARGNRAMAARNICAWDRTAEIGPELEAMVRAGLPVAPMSLLAYSSDKALQLQAGRNAVAALMPQRPAPLWRGEHYGHDRIRLAYVSSDFRTHAVGLQLAPLIECHDRSRFEVIAISIGGNDNSAARARLVAAFDRFEDCAALTDEQAARRMRDMEIDIAIDLNGHTGGARTGIFAWRPAPVQAAWLGYPGTMGADFIDALIADETVAPMQDQPFYSETLVHLPHSYFPTDPARPIAPAPSRAEAGLPPQGFVFCSFNNNWKFTPELWGVWMRLLQQAPGSVLWLKETNPAATRNLRREAKARDVDPARLVFAPQLASDAEHLARHALADLFLDTLPYNAHATASDALWAGLPVLTCRGEAFAGRVAASLLKAIGLPELVTETISDYEKLALRLAHEPQALKALKDKLAANRLTAALFDADGFRAAIEAVYTAMLQRSLGE